jgi:dipeptidase
MEIMRDSYAGTPFDVAAQPAFLLGDRPSPLACPWGPPELLELLQIRSERAICTPTSGYVLVAQLRRTLPDPIGNLLWFAYGPADTSCFLPLYAGTLDLPDSWDQPADFTRIDRHQAQWNFRLVQNLAHRVRYREAVGDIRAVIEPAEQRYLSFQNVLEERAAAVLNEEGPDALGGFLTDYAAQCAIDTGRAYSELVDFLMLRYLVGDPEFAAPQLPRIAPPSLPLRLSQ